MYVRVYNVYFFCSGSRHSSQSGSVNAKPYGMTSQSLPRSTSSTPRGTPSSSSTTMPRTSSASGRQSSKLHCLTILFYLLKMSVDNFYNLQLHLLKKKLVKYMYRSNACSVYKPISPESNQLRNNVFCL